MISKLTRTFIRVNNKTIRAFCTTKPELVAQ